VSKTQRETSSTRVPCRARRRARGLAALAVVVLAGGCARVVTVEGERLGIRSEELRRYVETVFREQNRVATALAFALEDAEDPERIDALEAAEEDLLAACSGLNAIAAARRDGERLRRLQALSAARAAPECERATADAESVLAP